MILILFNTSSNVYPHILWKSPKYAIRSNCMSYSFKIAAERKWKKSSLEKKIQQMESMQNFHYAVRAKTSS